MLIVINGPMKAGKSYEIIKYAQAYMAQGKKVVCIKPETDTRNDGIFSRAGHRLDAMTLKSLKSVPQADVYIVDESHFFPAEEVEYVEKWLDKSDVIIAGLDVGHKRELLPFYTKLYELKPDILISKVAECHVCHSYNANYTQILIGGVEYTGEFESAPVEDGTYEYQPRCRKCFMR